MRVIFTFIILSICSFNLQAQRLSLGNSASFYLPTSDLGDIYDPGFGVDVIADLKVAGIFGITARGGWFRLYGKDVSGGFEIEDANNWNAAVGARVHLIPIIYVEGRGTAIFPDEGDAELGFTAAAGVRPGKFDINLAYHFGDVFNFAELRIGYFWIKSDKDK